MTATAMPATPEPQPQAPPRQLSLAPSTTEQVLATPGLYEELAGEWDDWIVPEVVLALVRNGRTTHAVQAWAERALCGAQLGLVWSSGLHVTCPGCRALVPRYA